MTGETFRRAPSTIWDRVDGHVTVCDTRSGELYTLDPVAGELWTLLDARTGAELAERLRPPRPEPPPEVWRDHVAALLVLLQGAGLATADDERPTPVSRP